LLPFGALFASTALLACGSTTVSSGPGGIGGTSSNSSSTKTSTSTSTNTCGSSSVGGNGQSSTTSNNTSAGGNTGASQGGTSSSATTGTKATGGMSSTNTTAATGGKTGVGGTSASTGGTSSTSTKSTGGNTGVGGTSTSSSNNATGGNPGAGGTSAVAGASSTVAGGSSGTRPKGYYYLSDWKVSTPDWHGCVWTGQDSNVTNSTTKITPQDFTTGTDGGPYEISGKVTADPNYNGVAMLGFNISEAITGKADQCKYVAGVAGPDDISIKDIMSSTKGLAINWVAKTKPAQFRVQLQAKASLTDLKSAWCATITDAQGPSFVNWTDFYAYCWDYPTPVDNYSAVQYKGENIDAVSFLVPGTTAETPFDFTVTGFAPGNSKTDAPGPAAACGTMTGTLGNATTASQDASMQRAAVTDTNCKKYIVFNNNWGQPTSTTQTIDYTGNKLTVKSSTGSGSSAPASFPSIYIGANGDLAGGTYDTWSDSGLPKKVSDITSANTTFTWTGNAGPYNAAYDIWFSDKTPTAGAYNDAIAGFIMVWLQLPTNNYVPIGGSSKRTTGTIAGHKWNVWVGPRGNTSTGTNDANRPVISYVVADGPVKSLTFNIKDFMTDAVTNAATDKGNGNTSAAFSSSWYLTDVFAGFEAWSGSAIVGNTATMSCTIQ